MHVHSPNFQGQLIEKNYFDNFYSLGAKEGWKNVKKGQKCKKNIFLKILKVPHMFLHSFFKVIWKKIDFRSVALVKKRWDILDLLFYTTATHPPACLWLMSSVGNFPKDIFHMKLFKWKFPKWCFTNV